MLAGVDDEQCRQHHRGIYCWGMLPALEVVATTLQLAVMAYGPWAGNEEDEAESVPSG